MNLDYSVGLGKTIFNSSVALLPWNSLNDTEIVLTERLNRLKNSGAWPESPLKQLSHKLKNKSYDTAENRDVQTTLEFETYYNSRFPFLEHLKLQGLENFSTLHNPSKVFPHHVAHAWSAIAFSPFEDCLILVLDGAGSLRDENKTEKQYEHLSLFRWRNRKLELLEKKFLTFLPSKGKIQQSFSEGIGLFYEKTSEFIFNNKTEAGKVMGLAPFGKSLGLQSSYFDFLENLNWEKRYQGKSKKEWEQSSEMELFRDLAATVQENFEHYLFQFLNEVKIKYPSETNLIMTGGCALNCTFNGKLASNGLFGKIFIPPNPGDEGIGLGCAFGNFAEKNIQKWTPTPWNKLTSSRGLKDSVPKDHEIEEVFKDFLVTKPKNLISVTASLLAKGEIVAFMQGRSEIGPRALGNRSILATPLKPDLKNFLNENIKFREDFRPYGCTVPWDLAHEYFEIEKGFENPFMSFAVPVRDSHKEKLKHVSHIDGTSRMQTLHRDQNEIYYDLLMEMGSLTGLPILLNTSLNVMNEPIVETVLDAHRFFHSSRISVMVIGNFLIQKKG